MSKNSGQIQRIQSVYLLLATIVGASLFGLPFASAPAESEGLMEDGALDINDNMGLMILTVLVVVISLITIFMYNNRTLQMNLGKLNVMLTVALLAVAGYLFSTVMSVASIGGGLFVPGIVIVLLLVANSNILKDEKTVKSADRLRD